jgi:hypothetical protein
MVYVSSNLFNPALSPECEICVLFQKLLFDSHSHTKLHATPILELGTARWLRSP